MMSFTENAIVWPLAPNWANGVKEVLAWSTDIMQAPATGKTQHRQLRLAPRRSFAFDVLAQGQLRRLADLLLADHAAKIWRVPIWTDGQRLSTPVLASAGMVPCKTVGYDFAEGGQALIWTTINIWVLVDIKMVAADGLVLVSQVGKAFAAGATIYPVRAARVEDAPEEELLTATLGQRSVTFDIAESCDWPAADFLPTYLDHPVLEWRPDEGESPKQSSKHLITVVDNDTSLPAWVDLARIALRTQSYRWLLHSRAVQSKWRSVLYLLSGRATPVWMPSWSSDLAVVADIAAADTTLTIEWSGYTLYGHQQSGCRHVRIDAKGQVFYRRILSSVDAGATETLTLDAALGVAVPVRAIRQVSYLRLCVLASDTVEIEHQTDSNGLAICNLGFSEVAE